MDHLAPGPSPTKAHSTSNSIGSFLDYYAGSMHSSTPQPAAESAAARKASIQSSRSSAGAVRDSIEVDLAKSTTEHTSSSRRSTNTTRDPLLASDRDRYGFKKASGYLSADEYNRWWADYSKYAIRRKKRWEIMMTKNGFHVKNTKQAPAKFPPKSDELKRFVRKGIPAEWRGSAWFYFAKGPERLKANAGVYDRLCEESAQLHNDNTDAIEKDLHRTFPDNIHFNGGHVGESPLVQSLRRVLSCFAVFRPSIGYCQSLNFIAGLLLVFMDEERSFWMLVIMTEKYLSGIHDLTLEGVNVHQGVLLLCIREYLPNIWPLIVPAHQHAANEFLVKIPPLSLCTTSWFMSVFVGVLPIETTLRVWDCIFYEDSKTLFRVSLTIFKLIEPQLLSLRHGPHALQGHGHGNGPGHAQGHDNGHEDDHFDIEIFQILQNFPKKLVDCNLLIESCFKRSNGFGNLSQTEINNCKRFVKDTRDKFARLNRDAAVGDDLERQRLVRESLQIYGDKKMGLRGLSWNGKLNNRMKLIQHRLR